MTLYSAKEEVDMETIRGPEETIHPATDGASLCLQWAVGQLCQGYWL